MSVYRIRQRTCLLLCSCWLLCALLFGACDKVDYGDTKDLENKLQTTDVGKDVELRYFQNKPLPKGKCSLRILCIGNSYTVDAAYYLSSILRKKGFADSTFSVYTLTSSGASLHYWCDVAESGNRVKLNHWAGSKMSFDEGTLPDLLAQEWDVITLQQYSGDAIFYSTFHPWIRRLIDFVQHNCLNPDVTLAWHMAWSYSSLYGSGMSTYNRWLLISVAVQEMIMSDGIDVIIPIGTAIQNARATPLNTTGDLTCDGIHLDLGVGRYIAACTFYEALFAPVYEQSVLGDTFAREFTEDETAGYSYPPLSVRGENRDVCQQCAVAAVEAPFAITSIGGE